MSSSCAGSFIFILGSFSLSFLSLLRFFFFLFARCSSRVGGAFMVSFGTLGGRKQGSEATSSSTTDMHMSELASTGTGLWRPSNSDEDEDMELNWLLRMISLSTFLFLRG